jgi:hypothetical protein
MPRLGAAAFNWSKRLGWVTNQQYGAYARLVNTNQSICSVTASSGLTLAL